MAHLFRSNQFKSRPAKMQVSSVGGVRNRRVVGRVESPLSLYDTPPTEEISLDEFEEYAYDRLRVLKAIEMHQARGIKGEALRQKMREATNKYLPFRAGRDAEKDAECRRKDHVSHFILRLAYCRTEELRRWFLTQECALFRHRISTEMTREERRSFMKAGDFDYDVVSDEEKFAQQAPLAAGKKDTLFHAGNNLYVTHMSLPIGVQYAVFGRDFDKETERFHTTPDTLLNTTFYKVPFHEAADLVKKRACLITRGFAYVPENLLISILVMRFRAVISAALAHAHRVLPQVSGDARLYPVLTHLSKQYVGEDFLANAGKQGEVSAQEVDKIAKINFPLCMKSLHSGLQRDHKLRHGGRQQYGLFLKGIGLTLEGALEFWRTEFTKSMSAEDFNKKYAYNIRHNYGKEGKRTDYTPFSCSKIILGGAPAPGEHHGCPFRHFDETNLVRSLQRMKVSTGDCKDIVELVKGHNYQIACRKHFEVTHPMCEAEIESVGNHPNAYFEASRKYFKSREKPEKPKVMLGDKLGKKVEAATAAAPPAAAPAAAKVEA
jgi:DNA primase large subunit